MRKTSLILAAVIASGVTAAAQAQTHSVEMPLNAETDPEGAVAVRGYEWATFDPDKPDAHAPGAVLSAPGDAYRYTVMRQDDYAHNAKYGVAQAYIGIHIDMVEVSEAAQPWARIKINGEQRDFLKMLPSDERSSQGDAVVKVISDAELTGDPKGSFPPYVYDVTDILQRGDDVSVAVENVREDGSIDGDAPFAGFIINRIGSHVWYTNNEETP